MDLGQFVGISVPLTTIFTLAVIALLYLWLRKGADIAADLV